jgi:hypothetical protein
MSHIETPSEFRKEPQFETSTTIIENIIVDWNSNLQLAICEALSKSQDWSKSPWVQYNLLTTLKIWWAKYLIMRNSA